jgi:aminoglycoside 3-N-acetyltransferase I
MRIERVADAAAVEAGAELFDGPPLADATARFLASPTHHLLFAYDDDRVVGMISGVETTHPDKGTEMFLYGMGVDVDNEAARATYRRAGAERETTPFASFVWDFTARGA